MEYDDIGIEDMSETLKQLLNECRRSTQTDFEGSDSFRLHYKTAQDLVRRAYEAGKATRTSIYTTTGDR